MIRTQIDVVDMGVEPKNRGKTLKMDGKNSGKSY